MSSQIPVMSTHHHCGNEMFSSVNLNSQVIQGYMSGMEESSEVENLFWSKPEMLHECPEP